LAIKTISEGLPTEAAHVSDWRRWVILPPPAGIADIEDSMKEIRERMKPKPPGQN